jgi:DNA-binding response OmpR family regulator
MSEAKKVLLVDDEVDITMILSRRLSVNGYEIDTAKNGIEALEKVKSFNPDLMILDVTMPKMNGYQVCQTLRKQDATKNLPIIMLTARAEESDKSWGEEVGATSYMPKPFEDEALLKEIKKLIG